ncbi:unnamed protein product, partial [Iphiclides podalirius]
MPFTAGLTCRNEGYAWVLAFCVGVRCGGSNETGPYCTQALHWVGSVNPPAHYRGKYAECTDARAAFHPAAPYAPRRRCTRHASIPPSAFHPPPLTFQLKTPN